MNNQPTQQMSESEAYEAGINNILKDLYDWFGSWDDLRKRIDELEQESRENAGERHFSRDLK